MEFKGIVKIQIMSIPVFVPHYASLEQYTNVQRGTIIMVLLNLFIIFIGVCTKIVVNRLDEKNDCVENKNVDTDRTMTETQRAFDKNTINFQQINEDDSGTIKFVKKITEFNTTMMPILILFPMNFITGATYSFNMSLYFLVMLSLLLFNLIQVHKKCVRHKVILGFMENLWLILSFCWFVNIWATQRWIQTYYMF